MGQLAQNQYDILLVWEERDLGRGEKNLEEEHEVLSICQEWLCALLSAQNVELSGQMHPVWWGDGYNQPRSWGAQMVLEIIRKGKNKHPGKRPVTGLKQKSILCDPRNGWQF